MSGQAVIQVFAKAPAPGEVKTRLIPALGARGAAELQEKLIERTLEQALAAKVGRVELWCAPDTEHPFFRRCRRRYRLRMQQQRGEDLGARMSEALEAGLARGELPVLVGTDCTEIWASDFEQAALWLRSGTDAVFCPVEDGGYVLVALSRPAPFLFADMPWSSPQVIEETRRRLSANRFDWRELDGRFDLDRPEDLRRAPAWLLPGERG